MVDAPVEPISAAKPLPAGVKPTGPVAEVLKLVDSAVDESVMLAFVTNSTTPFNLGVEEIIYLNDIGVPNAVVTAMIQRDQVLKALPGNATPAPAATATPTPQPEPTPELTNAPAVTEMAPQPDATAATYPVPADGGYGTFYDSLAPYGSWINVDGYGACWQPTVVIINSGWRPYCHGGRWVYSDCGWYWLSGYSWGWAPFHYGRWFCHSRIGWCWQPGYTWGPSWVSWRYSGNYCGWAPLPPAAGFSVGVGLTYHGQRVNSGFAFGLSSRSYTFVPVNHFGDPHPNRYAVPRQQAPQVYNQTVASTTVVGNSTRIINRGIPVSRVEAATRTRIKPVGIHETSTGRTGGVRGERFESNNRTLTVYRPHFAPSSGAQPAANGRPQPSTGGRSRSDIRPGSGGTTTLSSPATASPTSARPSAGFGRNTGTQPNSTLHVIGRTDRSFGGARPSQSEPGAAAPAPASPNINPAQKPAEPIILRGSDRSRETAGGGNAGGSRNATPSNSLIIRGSRDNGRPQASSAASAPSANAVQSRPMTQQQNPAARPARTQRPQSFQTAEAQNPSQSQWSAPRPAEPQVRATQPQQDAFSRQSAPQRSHSFGTGGSQGRSQSEGSARVPAPQVRAERPQQQSPAPSYSAPVQVPRSTPAPAPAAQPARSYSQPPASSPPRTESVQSQPPRSSSSIGLFSTPVIVVGPERAATIAAGGGRNPKPDDRRPKEGRGPKSEQRWA